MFFHKRKSKPLRQSKELTLQTFLRGPGAQTLYGWLGYDDTEMPQIVFLRTKEWTLNEESVPHFKENLNWVAWVFRATEKGTPHPVLSHLLPSSNIEVAGTPDSTLWICTRKRSLTGILQPLQYLAAHLFLPPLLNLPSFKLESLPLGVGPPPSNAKRYLVPCSRGSLCWSLSPLKPYGATDATWAEKVAKVLWLYGKSRSSQTGMEYKVWEPLNSPLPSQKDCVVLNWQLSDGSQALQVGLELGIPELEILLVHQGFSLEAYKRRFGAIKPRDALHLLQLVLLTHKGASLEKLVKPLGDEPQWGEFLCFLPQEDFEVLQQSFLHYRPSQSISDRSKIFPWPRWQASLSHQNSHLRSPLEGDWLAQLQKREATSQKLLSIRGQRIFYIYYLLYRERGAREGLKRISEESSALQELYELDVPWAEQRLRAWPDRKLATVLLSSKDQRWRQRVSAAHEKRLRDEMAFLSLELQRQRIPVTQIWETHLEFVAWVKEKG